MIEEFGIGDEPGPVWDNVYSDIDELKSIEDDYDDRIFSVPFLRTGLNKVYSSPRYSVIENEMRSRIIVEWDRDNDERIFFILNDLNRTDYSKIVMVGEQKGSLQVYFQIREIDPSFQFLNYKIKDHDCITVDDGDTWCVHCDRLDILSGQYRGMLDIDDELAFIILNHCGYRLNISFEKLPLYINHPSFMIRGFIRKMLNPNDLVSILK